MKKSDKTLENSAKNALLACLTKITFLKVIRIDAKSDERSDQQFDITAKIKIPEGVLKVIAEVKSSGQPRLAREAVNQMLRYKDKVPDAYFVFIAPFITSKAAEICESENVGYLDLSGNCMLSFDKIYIQKTNYPNKFKEKRDLKSLYSPKAERILRVLLCNPGKKWKIKELADESAVSLGQTSNVKKILFDRELLTGNRGAFSLKDPDVLLREWAAYHDYRRNKILEFYSFKSVTDIENTFAGYCNNKKIKYVLAGFSGAARIEPAVMYKKAMIYSGEPTEDALSEISAKAVQSGGNLLLFIPYDDGVFYGSTKVNEVNIASEVQLYLDLQGFRGRGEEAAEVLYERIVEKAW